MNSFKIKCVNIALLIFLTSIPLFSFSQSGSKLKGKTRQSIEKWTRAAVGLEMRRFAFEEIAAQKKIKTIREGLIPVAQNFGSSVFLKYNGRRYLITARHVLYDKWMVSQRLKYNPNDTIDIRYSIYMNIFQILRYQESLDTSNGEVLNSELPLLGAAPYAQRRYIYSDTLVDLAIISLDGGYLYSHFADNLERKGYAPISLSDIDTSELEYGQDLICIGYPAYSFQSYKSVPDTMQPYQSITIFEPAVTFGKVSIPNSRKTFFLGDIAIGPGNSGGALVSNNKLVGIVSAQPLAPIHNKFGEEYGDALARIPSAIGIKASLIIPLLFEMIKKDDINSGPNLRR